MCVAPLPAELAVQHRSVSVARPCERDTVEVKLRNTESNMVPAASFGD